MTDDSSQVCETVRRKSRNRVPEYVILHLHKHGTWPIHFGGFADVLDSLSATWTAKQEPTLHQSAIFLDHVHNLDLWQDVPVREGAFSLVK